MERIPKSQVLRKALQEIVTGAVIEGNLNRPGFPERPVYLSPATVAGVSWRL